MAYELYRQQRNVDNEIRCLKDRISIQMPDNPVLWGWKTFARCDEDGIINECLKRIGRIQPLNRCFIEIGRKSNLENNTYNLILNDFCGCWIDEEWELLEEFDKELGKSNFSQLQILRDTLTYNNIQVIFRSCLSFLGTQDIDFLSINNNLDISILEKVLDFISPKLICVEYNSKFPPPMCCAVSKDDITVWQEDDYYGVSLQSLVDWMKGYTLVACNLSGMNAFFVNSKFIAPFTPYPPEEIYQPIRLWLADVTNGYRPSYSWLRQKLSKRKTLEAGVVKTSVKGLRSFDFKVHEKTDLYISKEIIETGVWEEFETELFRKICERHNFFLDIGANIGWYTVIANMCMLGKGKIIAFEPDPDNYEILQFNVSQLFNDSLVTMKAAVGDEDGKINLYKDKLNLGDHRLYPRNEKEEFLPVRTVTLDSFFEKEENFPTLVKSDTQGGELDILKGAQHLFSQGWRPTWFFEFWPFGLRLSKKEPFSLWCTMEALNYQQFEICRNERVLKTITKDYIIERLETDLKSGEGFLDIIALQPDSLDYQGIKNYIR